MLFRELVQQVVGSTYSDKSDMQMKPRSEAIFSCLIYYMYLYYIYLFHGYTLENDLFTTTYIVYIQNHMLLHLLTYW